MSTVTQEQMQSLPESELQPVLEKLGLGLITNDLEGLRAFYRAWCLGVPFDDLQKTLALFENGGPPLPTLDARRFFADWLTCGTGGTCWQHSDALYTLARTLGFDARRAVASMYDTGEGGHGTVVVNLPDRSTWILDNAMLTMEPLRIDPECPSNFEGAHYAEVEIAEEGIYVYGCHPPMFDIFFRLLEVDVPRELYVERWARTHERGPFVRTVHIRRNDDDRFYVLRSDTLYTCIGSEIGIEKLDRDGVLRHLTDTFDISPEFVARWAASGALDSSFDSPGPFPELPQRTAPSKRII